MLKRRTSDRMSHGRCEGRKTRCESKNHARTIQLCVDARHQVCPQHSGTLLVLNTCRTCCAPKALSSRVWRGIHVQSRTLKTLSLIHISEPTRRTPISYAVFCLKKKKIKTLI